MKKLKVAVIGVGGISAYHIEPYMKNPNVELYALCDIDEAKLKLKGEKYNITRLYTDAETMLTELPEIDAVSVCTSNDAHAKCSIIALNKGKHVLCEKPMAKNYNEALEMIKAQQESGKTLGVGFVRRYGKDAELAKEFIDNGKLGEVYYAKARYVRRNGCPGRWFGDIEKSGGGPLIDLGVHVIDLVRYLCGSPKAVSVYGCTFSKLKNRPNIKSPRIFLGSDQVNTTPDVFNVEDLATALVRFDNGLVLSVETSFTLNTEGDDGAVEIFGTKGGLKFNPELKFYTEMENYMVDVSFPNPVKFESEGFAAQINGFVDMAINGTEFRGDSESGLELMRIIDAIYLSAKTGHEVVL